MEECSLRKLLPEQEAAEFLMLFEMHLLDGACRMRAAYILTIIRLFLGICPKFLVCASWRKLHIVSGVTSSQKYLFFLLPHVKEVSRRD